MGAKETAAKRSCKKKEREVSALDEDKKKSFLQLRHVSRSRATEHGKETVYPRFPNVERSFSRTRV